MKNSAALIKYGLSVNMTYQVNSQDKGVCKYDSAVLIQTTFVNACIQNKNVSNSEFDELPFNKLFIIYIWLARGNA